MTTVSKTEKSGIEVPLLDLKAQYRTIESEVLHSVREVCSNQRFILGPSVKTLEERIAAYCQCGFGVGVSSGTDALLVALMALDIGAGDAVITTPYSFFATAGVISRLGARPIFCDIDAATYNLDPAAVVAAIDRRCELRGEQLVERRTGAIVKAIIPVHLYGQTADMDPILEVAKRYRLKVVEDAAQAIGAEYRGRRAGSMGDIGCLSFFPSKNLGSFGDGGMCVTRDSVLAERLRILRVHGAKPKYYHSVIGGNFRLDELQAAVLLVKLDHLESWTRARQENACYYDAAFAAAGLGPRVVTPRIVEGNRHVYNQYVLRVERRDELRKHLDASKIGTEIYYPVSLHMQACFQQLGYVPEDCQESWNAARETLAIPIYPELTRDQQEHVVRAVAAFYG